MQKICPKKTGEKKIQMQSVGQKPPYPMFG